LGTVGALRASPGGVRPAARGLIPDDLRQNADRDAFADDANPTAVADWRYFREVAAAVGVSAGLPTGFPALDEATGGLKDLCLVAGRTGSGKSTLVLNAAVNLLEARPDAGVLLVTAEEAKVEFFRKLWGRVGGVKLSDARPGHQDKVIRAKLETAHEAIESRIAPRLRVLTRLHQRRWTTNGIQQVMTHKLLVEAVDSLLTTAGVSRVLVVLDSLEYADFLVDHPEPQLVRSTPDNLTADVLKLKELKRLLAWYNANDTAGRVTVVAVARVSSKGTCDGPLDIGDVRGSSDLTFEPSQVLLVSRDGPSNAGVTPTLVRVAKARATGVEGDIRLDHHYETATFTVVGGGPAGATATAKKTRPTKPRSRG
jgi:energy-coupling factor transporter ATP-binding protein EcfA2